MKTADPHHRDKPLDNTDKSSTMQVLPPALVPLAAYPQFILHKNKQPVDHRTASVANAHDPAIWTDAETAIATAKLFGDEYGVGFVLTTDDPFFVVDIDKCAEADGWSQVANDIKNLLPGAAIEVSQSGRGLHIWGTGTIPEHACKNTKLRIELYHQDRYIAFGDMDTVTGSAATDCTVTLPALVTHYFTPTTTARGDEWTIEPLSEYTPFPNDDALIETAKASGSAANKLGGKAGFKQLWERDIPALADSYPDPVGAREYDGSSADMALALYLAFYTGCNCEHMVLLMWDSKLARDKWWKHKSYLQKTILRAASLQKDVYTGGKRTPVNDVYSPTYQIPKKNFPDLKVNSEGIATGIKATNENLLFLIDGYGIKTSYDVHSKEPNFIIPGLAETVYGKNDVAIGEIISKAARCGLPVGKLDNSIIDLSYKNPEFPIREYLASLQWDGTDRIAALCNTLQVPEESIQARNAIITLWLIQCVAAADGAIQTSNKDALPRYEYVVVLGGAQGLNKTRWLRGLMPKPLQKYFKDGLTLDPTNKDSVIKATGFWIVELGEIDATFDKKKLAHLKAFLSETVDVYRSPYGRAPNPFPRMTSFCGSVNEMRFLKDATGNRRYLPITPYAIKLPDDAGIDINQVWAQVWQLYMSGAQWWPSDAEEAVIQASREAVEQDHETAIGERLTEIYGEFTVERKALPGSCRRRPMEIAREIGIFEPSNKQYADIRNYMERNNLDQFGRPDSTKHASQVSWNMPPRLITFPVGVPR